MAWPTKARSLQHEPGRKWCELAWLPAVHQNAQGTWIFTPGKRAVDREFQASAALDPSAHGANFHWLQSFLHSWRDCTEYAQLSVSISAWIQRAPGFLPFAYKHN
jgi:hypothetical protein